MKRIIALLVVLALLTLAFYYFKGYFNDSNEGVACTMEAMQCPDGSYVGRTGPNCEFVCPTGVGAGESVKEVNDSASGLTYKYPDNLYLNKDGISSRAEYISLSTWPPQVAIFNEAFSCSDDITQIGGVDYCKNVVSEGAAGSVYTTYSYKRAVEGKTVTISFDVRTPQCMNYDEPKRGECQKEVELFNADTLAVRVFNSMTFK